MSSTVRFDPPGVEGLVASGTLLSDAAERLGVPIALACGGVGACTTCAVRMLENPFALSEVTDAERRTLGDERLADGVRLGCQAYVRTGDCAAHVLEEPARGAAAGATAEEPPPAAGARERILEEFEQLPTADRLATAVELQLKAAGDLIGALVEVPLKAGEELFAAVFGAPKAPDDEPKKDGDGGSAEEPGSEEPHE